MSLDVLTEKEVLISRSKSFDHKVVFVDGFAGCGKTMLAPIIASLDRVELLTYAFTIEYLCILYSLGKIDQSAITTMIRLNTDMQIYDTMQGRVNFRIKDLSSALNDVNPLRYVRRMFLKGDEVIPERIRQEKPILHLTTHRLLRNSDPIFEALKERLVFVEVVRHPLYMIKQKSLNMERLIGSPRDFDLYCSVDGYELPSWAVGWEEKFKKANSMERAIYLLDTLTRQTKEAKKELARKHNAQIVTTPFECFVLDPEPYLEKITRLLGTQVTPLTRRMMKKQRVPRKKYADGLKLKIYERCGWTPPVSGDENKEFELRWQYAAQRASKDAMAVLDRLCIAYEEEYLGGKKDYKKVNGL